MQDKIESDIEDIELHDKNAEQIEKIVKAFSPEGMELRRKRKKIRYQLYRMRSEALGMCSRLSCTDDDFVKQFEIQNDFTYWRDFSIHWDVAMDDPYRVVHRSRSTLDEWEDIVKAKYPQIKPNGGIEYPDIKVRKKIEEEAKNHEIINMKHKKKKKSATKKKKNTKVPN